jgi:hypothetical protein
MVEIRRSTCSQVSKLCTSTYSSRAKLSTISWMCNTMYLAKCVERHRAIEGPGHLCGVRLELSAAPKCRTGTIHNGDVSNARRGRLQTVSTATPLQHFTICCETHCGLPSVESNSLTFYDSRVYQSVYLLIHLPLEPLSITRVGTHSLFNPQCLVESESCSLVAVEKLDAMLFQNSSSEVTG